MTHPRYHTPLGTLSRPPESDWSLHCRFAVIGDVHGQWGELDRVLLALKKATNSGADLSALFMTGDFTKVDTRSMQLALLAEEEVWEAMQAARLVLTGTSVLGVPGNHDVPDARDSGLIDGLWTHHCHRGPIITGIGGAGPARFGWPYEWTDDEIAAWLKLRFPHGIAPGVILSHGPPFGLCDQNASGIDCGSRTLRDVAERHRGLFICGHIHEARGVSRIGDCTVVNAGALGRPWPWIGYTRIEGSLKEGWTVDFVEVP